MSCIHAGNPEQHGDHLEGQGDLVSGITGLLYRL